jgi:hypothetical protein
MPLKGLECLVSKPVNSDACPRPTTLVGCTRVPMRPLAGGVQTNAWMWASYARPDESCPGPPGAVMPPGRSPP